MHKRKLDDCRKVYVVMQTTYELNYSGDAYVAAVCDDEGLAIELAQDLMATGGDDVSVLATTLGPNPTRYWLDIPEGDA